MDFLASCVSPCLFSFVQVTFPYPQSLPRVTLLIYLPTCLQLVSLSSLHYRASFQVSSIWDGEDSFSPLSFLSFLVPVVFPSAFFTSLLIPVVLAFGTQDSPCLPCVPICVLIQPVFSYLLCGLGFRTFRCFGAINITEPLICVPSVTALLQSPLFISFCPSLLLFFFLGASGHRILFVTLRGCSMAKDSSCLPFVSILVSLSVPNLSPYFSISIAILLSGCFRSKESPCLPFLTSLSIAQCSSFWWLWGQDSSPIWFRTRLSTSLSHVAVLSGCFRGTVCSLSSVCLRACPPCSLQLMPLLLSLFFSLSLLLFFSLGAFLDTWFSLVPHLSSLVLVCSLQHVSLIPSSLLLLLGKEWISWPLVFLLNFSSFVQVTFPYPRSLPHVTLLTFLLVSNLSPYSLSTTVLLSRSPAFGRERIVFLLFPFFPSLSLWSFPALSSLLSSFLLFSLLGPKIPLVSHVFPSVSLFSQFFPTCCFV